jgi:hypothetical protein
MMLTEYLEARSKPFLVSLGYCCWDWSLGVYITSTHYVLEFSPFYLCGSVALGSGIVISVISAVAGFSFPK